MMMDKQSELEKAREIVYTDDFFKSYADIVPEVGERLETYVFEFADALSQARLEGIEEGRREAIEECAKVADKRKLSEWEMSLYTKHPDCNHGIACMQCVRQNKVATEIAKAIRQKNGGESSE